MSKFVIYKRLSKQKDCGNQYGFQSQDHDIDYFLNTQIGAEVIAQFSEFYSGKPEWTERKELVKAVKLCEQTGATLLVSKVDRLGRSVESVAHLLKRVSVRIAVMPSASNMVIQMLAVMAEEEARAISDRVKKALTVAKENGKKLGGSAPKRKLSQEREYLSLKERDEKFRSLIESGRSKGLTYRQLADRFNELGIKSPKGSSMTAATVQRAANRLNII